MALCVPLPHGGPRRVALALLVLLQLLCLSEALRTEKPQKPPPPIPKVWTNRTYLWHVDCRTADGLGGHVIKVRPYISIAVEHGWQFVCNPKDWETWLHHTGNMGYLFGCNNLSSAVGDMAPYDLVAGYKWIGLGDLKNKSQAEPNAVYQMKECKSMPPWGASWPWFRSQFNLVRTADPTRRQAQCWPPVVEGEPQKLNVVIAVRKGDDPWRSFGAPTYLRLLSAIFLGGQMENITRIPASKANVVVIAEATQEDHDMVMLSQGFASMGVSSTFLLGAPEKNETVARQRLVRDLDCMALSDVFVASVSGLSDLAAAVQPTGITLVLEGHHTHRHEGVTNAQHVDVHRGTQNTFQILPHELPNARRVLVEASDDGALVE
uniref:Uncharacterized protein n=1 Tax=Alexandrium catenella TaxID=2925 RepID=A0A7S1Q0I3_ALECA